MLAGTTRHDVGDGRQRASLEINEILREIDDVREEARRIDESGEGQEGSPDDLWTMCVLGAKGLLGVVILDVHLPADASALQPIEDGLDVEAVWRYAAVTSSRLSGDPIQVVGLARTPGRAEEPVGQDIVLGEIPIQRQVAPIPIAHRHRWIQIPISLGQGKSVHSPVIVRTPGALTGMVGVGRMRRREVIGRDATAARSGDGLANLLRDAVGPRECSKIIVEGMVLLHQHYEVVDRYGISRHRRSWAEHAEGERENGQKRNGTGLHQGRTS